MRLSVAALVSLALLAGVPAGAQNFPTRPVRVLVPYGPGGGSDIVARLVTERMRQTLNQAFIVENKPGASGLVAIGDLARSQPDGYTLLVGNVTTNAITPVIFKSKMKMDYESSIVTVTRLASIPNVLVASATSKVPIKSVAELVEYGRANPGKLNYGSSGAGSYAQFDAVMLAKHAGFEAVHVPTQGGAPGMVTDMVRGDVHWGFINPATALGMIREGKLVALAVTSKARVKDLPDVPTMAEAGYPGVGTDAWQALFAPAGTPTPILETLRNAAVDALTSPQVKLAFEQQVFSADPTPSLGAAKAWMDDELNRWRKTVAEADITLD